MLKTQRPAWAIRLQEERELRGWGPFDMARQLLRTVGVENPSLSRVRNMYRQILRWENGENYPGTWAPVYAETFGIPLHELYPEPPPRQSERLNKKKLDTLAQADVNVEISTPLHAGDDEMERRALMQLAALGIGAGAFGSTGEPVRQLLAQALDSESRDLHDWHLTVSDHLHALRTRAPAHVSTSLMIDLIAAQRQLHDGNDDATDLRRVIAALSILHANALTRLGDQGAAIHWSRTARSAADMSGDLDLRLMVRCEEAAYGLYGQRDMEGVLCLIEDAERIAGATPSFWLADLSGTRAKALARLGRLTEAKQALNTFVGYEGDDARTSILPGLATGSQAPFAESWVYAHEGDQAKADAARELVLSRTRDYQYGANVRLHEALCTVVNGGTDTGARQATQILDALPSTQQSHMINDTGRAILQAIPREQRTRPAAQDLHALLNQNRPNQHDTVHTAGHA
ncbi:hypothetical protein AGRA3207_002416 [Actinomadura graeca]|uniref:XRE family transcriptional regulator n=1 Tax=Actinomadura graeca TaxID=2750812 RepID=A0ABX8QS75_9ACTN|nr:hypothetical protein [Actinomadura graeca]QXJ21555.1 hypothetical protein AGRA3207_002416 [Actinomadura graeca]